MAAHHRTSSRRRSRLADVATLLGFGVVTGLTALLGARSTRRGMARRGARPSWYEELEKPPFQPPQRLFAPVWTALYGLIAVSGWRIYRRPPSDPRSHALALWAAQLKLNGLWSWLFFGKRRIRVALADCALLLVTTGAYMNVARRVDRTAAGLFVPYSAWVAFATLLNAELVRRNPAPPSAEPAG